MPRRYVTLPDDYGPGEKKRRALVVEHNGEECIFVDYTDHCSGCTDYGDYGTVYGGGGCQECGYTGRRRWRQYVPLRDLGLD